MKQKHYRTLCILLVASFVSFSNLATAQSKTWSPSTWYPVKKESWQDWYLRTKEEVQEKFRDKKDSLDRAFDKKLFNAENELAQKDLAAYDAYMALVFHYAEQGGNESKLLNASEAYKAFEVAMIAIAKDLEREQAALSLRNDDLSEGVYLKFKSQR